MEGRLLGDVVLWKEKARTLQLQIRDRFRVAVDRRRQWYASTSPAVPPSYYCRPTIRRWIQRLRGFLHDAAQMKPSPSSAASRFYCKRVGKDVEAIDDSVILRFLQALAVPVIGSACHVFMHGLNHIQIYGAEKLHKALLERPQGKPLLTVSNHVAAVDDPFVIASLLPPNVMLDARNVRWTLCATDRCFSNPMFSAFFRCVKVLPVSRGDGIYQKGMDLAISKLNNGGWVHIFPEGSRSRDGGRTMGAAKRGVGRLVMDADKIPIVVPFVHMGMQDIMPVGTHFPQTGKRVFTIPFFLAWTLLISGCQQFFAKCTLADFPVNSKGMFREINIWSSDVFQVTILVGDPIQFDDLLPAIDEANCMETPRGILYDSVSSRIGNRLQELKIQVERLVFEQCLEAQSFHQSCREDADGIWQLVDWEMFGFDNYISSVEWTPPVSRAVIQGTSPLHNQQQSSGNICQSVKAGLLQGGGIVSRIRGYMNPSELMGFAASGLFVKKDNFEHNQISFQEVGSIKAWRSFFEENVLHPLNNI